MLLAWEGKIWINWHASLSTLEYSWGKDKDYKFHARLFTIEFPGERIRIRKVMQGFSLSCVPGEKDKDYKWEGMQRT